MQPSKREYRETRMFFTGGVNNKKRKKGGGGGLRASHPAYVQEACCVFLDSFARRSKESAGFVRYTMALAILPLLCSRGDRRQKKKILLN